MQYIIRFHVLLPAAILYVCWVSVLFWHCPWALGAYLVTVAEIDFIICLCFSGIHAKHS